MSAPVHLWIATISVALLSACSARTPAALTGTLERHRLEIAAPVTEQVISVMVREGERVTADQVLAQLDQRSATASRDAAANEVQRAQRYLDQLQHGARREEIRAAQAQLAATQAIVEQSSRETTRLASLVGSNLISRSSYEQQVAARDTAIAQRDAAAAQLQLLQAGTRTEQVAQAQASLSAAQAQLDQQATALAKLTLRAPSNARVEAIIYRTGERPVAGQPVVVLMADELPFARVYISETDRARISIGQVVTLHADGITMPLQGRVRYVASDAAFTPYYALTQRDRGRLTYLAEIDVIAADTTQTAALSETLPSGLPVSIVLNTGAP